MTRNAGKNRGREAVMKRITAILLLACLLNPQFTLAANDQPASKPAAAASVLPANGALLDLVAGKDGGVFHQRKDGKGEIVLEPVDGKALSIRDLFIAGVLPGIMLAGLFMGFIIVWALFNQARMPPPEPHVPFGTRIYASRRLIPVTLLILGVIGSIYGGLASATEAAVVGVFLSLALSWWSGTLTKASFRDSLLGATRTSCMIAFILAGAAYLTAAMGFTTFVASSLPPIPTSTTAKSQSFFLK